MGCDTLRVKWMYVKLRDKRSELLKPILPTESIMLNVAMQRGRWEDYKISMTINATSSGTPGHQMAVFFKDFIVIVDAGANEREYYGSGKIEAIIPFTSIQDYEIVSEKISDDYEKKYVVFTMKKDAHKFAFKLFEKRHFDDNYNYSWDYTPKTNGREIGFYTNVIDSCLRNAIDYGKRVITVLKIMSYMKEGYNYKEFQNYIVEDEEKHWAYVLKFLRTMSEDGNSEYGAIYNTYKDKQDKSYKIAIDNNKKIKEITLEMKQLHEEIAILEDEIPNLGFFSRNVKAEKLKRLEELDLCEPELVRQTNALKEEIEKSHEDIENLKKDTLEKLYQEIIANESYRDDLLESFLMQNGCLSFDQIAFLLDMFDWYEPEHAESDAKKFLVSLVKRDLIILEENMCYYKSALDDERLSEIETKRDSSIESIFNENKDRIYNAIEQEVLSKKVLRKQPFIQLLNEEMMSHIGCLSDNFNNQIIDTLINNGIMKDINSVFVSLK